MVYQELLEALEKSNIRYVIVGGIAVILHGFARISIDLDLAVSLDLENASQFLRVVEKLGYRPRLPVDLKEFVDPNKRKIWAEEKNMRVFTLIHPKRPQELVDIFVQDIVPFDELYARRSQISLGSLNVQVVSLPDLKTLKRIAGRPQDLQDIAALEALEKKGS